MLCSELDRGVRRYAKIIFLQFRKSHFFYSRVKGVEPESCNSKILNSFSEEQLCLRNWISTCSLNVRLLLFLSEFDWHH